MDSFLERVWSAVRTTRGWAGGWLVVTTVHAAVFGALAFGAVGVSKAQTLGPASACDSGEGGEAGEAPDGDECNPPNQPTPPPAPQAAGSSDGEPVDMLTGIFWYAHSDLAIRDVVGIGINRLYQQQDNLVHAFGPGWSMSYEMRLYDPGAAVPAKAGKEFDLVLSDGTQIPFTLQSDGSYKCTTVPDGQYYGATLAYEAVGPDGVAHYLLTQRNQTAMRFDLSRGKLQSITDRNGNAVTFTQDASGNITRVTSPNGRFIQFTYTTIAGNPVITQATDNIGRVVTYNYDSTSGRLVSVIDADQTILPASQQASTSYQYDSSGRLWTIKDKRSNTVLTNVYYAAPDNRIQKQTLADGTTWQYAYSADASTASCSSTPCTQVTNPRGYVTEYDFNSAGYVTRTTVAKNAATPFAPQVTQTFRYTDGSNRVMVVLDALHRSTVFGYDAQGNVNEIQRLANISGETVTQDFVFDPTYSQLTSYTNELGKTTQYGLDDYGNVTSITNPLNNQWLMTRNLQGLVQQVTTPMGNQTTLSYNQADLQSVTDPSGSSVNYSTDEVGRVMAVSDAAGNVTTFGYDNLDRLANVTDPNWGYTSIGRDGNGNVNSVLLAGHQQAYTQAWDARDNYQAMTDPLGRNRWGATYDGNGNLKTSVDGKNQSTSYTFDPFDRLQEVDFKDGSSLKYTYDSGNRLTQVVDSLNGTTTITPDDYDHVSSVQTPYGTVGYQFDPLGRMQSIQYPSGLKVSYTYDDANQFKTVTIGGDTAMQVTSDSDGRLQTVTYPNGALRYYAYNQNQLTALFYEDTTNKLLGFWAYDYDTAGRIQSIRGSLVKAVVPTAMTATYDDANQIATLNGATLTSDGNGSQLADAGLSLSYNVRGQMVGATAGGTTASYQTNPFGWRDTKTVNGVTTHYLYDLAGHLLAEVDASNKVQREYVWMGDMPVMLRVYDASGQATEYNIWADHLNTPRVVTDTSNNIVWKWDSDLYGNGAPSGSLTFNLRFPGQYYDAETGLHYNGARYYNPKTARYIQSDPIGLNVGWNTYAYVRGNPVSETDPRGLFGVAVGAGGGETVGVGHEASSGVYYSPDACGRKYGGYTSNATSFGAGAGLGVSATVFFGDGTKSFAGDSKYFTLSLGDFSLGFSFNSGSLSAVSVGFGEGGFVGATAGTSNTRTY